MGCNWPCGGHFNRNVVNLLQGPIQTKLQCSHNVEHVVGIDKAVADVWCDVLPVAEQNPGVLGKTCW
eukprot:730984-Amphidinium_carterae.1